MGAAESKRWLELMSDTSETPTKPENKRLGKVCELEDPRSPSCQMPRTPIHLQTYEESPQNLELRIPDPRSPTLQISRTPLNLPTDNKSRENDLRKEVLELETEKKCDLTNVEVLSDNHNSITAEPPSLISPGAPLTKKDKVNLLKKTVSPADFKRKTKKRSTRRQSVPQKLFSESVEPAPRSPLAQHNSLDDCNGRTGKKGKKYSTSHKKISVQYEELWDAGKENARTPMVQ